MKFDEVVPVLRLVLQGPKAATSEQWRSIPSPRPVSNLNSSKVMADCFLHALTVIPCDDTHCHTHNEAYTVDIDV